MDPTSFAAPSRVRALVVPAAAQPGVEFGRCVDSLRRAARVPLMDVQLPPTTVPTGQFDPKSNPTGCITYSIETSAVPQAHSVLMDLEPYRRQALVLGVLQDSSEEFAGLGKESNEPGGKPIEQGKEPTEPEKESNELGTSLENALQTLRKAYPSALYHAIILFSDSPPSLPPGIFCVQPSNWTSVETTLATVSGVFLDRIASFWATRQLASFQSPLELLPAESKPQLQHQLRQQNQTLQSGMQGQQTVRGHSRAHNLSLGRHGSISMTSTERAKAQQNGRSQKFYGSLLMLAGQHQAALTELGAAAASLQQTGDHLWFGSALCDIAACLAILKAESAPVHTPAVALSAAWAAALRLKKSNSKPASDTSSIGGNDSARSGSGRSPSVHSVESISIVSRSMKKAKPFTDQTPLEDVLEYIIAAALDEFATGTGSELVPYTVYYEAICRYAGFLVNLRYSEWAESLEGVSQYNPAPHQLAAGSAVPLTLIDQWISRVYDLSTDLSPDTQAKILGAAARLYAAAGMRRKWAFACAQIVSLLASSAATVDADLGEVQNVLHAYSTWPKLEAQMLRKLVALGHRIRNPQLQTGAASQLLQMAIAAAPAEQGGAPASNSGASSASSSTSHGSTPTSKTIVNSTEQLTLYHLIRNFGDVVQSPFWDEQVLVNANIRALRLTTVPPPSSSQRDGIIYNPFEGTETREECSVEAGVPTKARVWLRNPLAVDIQVFQMALVNESGELVSEPVKDFVIPAFSRQFRVDTGITPKLSATTLDAWGCLVHVSGCAASVYKLDSPISLPIVPPRPVLALQELSLLKGCAMMLEGERRTFTLELWNSSQTECRILHFGYNESLIQGSATAAATANTSGKRGDISRPELYESEVFVHKRKAVELCDFEPDSIMPRSSARLNFRLFGKPGLQGASVLVDYGYSADKLRRIKIPLQITVHRSVWIERCSVLPGPADSECVLLMLDIRNGWRQSVKCNVWAASAPQPEPAIIESGATHRLLLEVPWKTPEPSDLSQTIPLLSQKQYTVDRQTTQEQLQRFWLRERLLSCLKSEWEVDGRKGEIELRKIELCARSADVLRRSSIEITAQPTTKEPMIMDEILGMKVTVSNKSSSPVQGMLRLAPNKAAQRFMLVMGCSQQLVTVEPQQQVDVVFDMLFVSRGSFQLAAVLDLPTGAVFQTGKTTLNITH